MTEQILSYFTFNITELIGISLLFIVFVIQLFYYFNYYRKPYTYVKNLDAYDGLNESNKPKVSIIIVSENEVDSLSENLPAILEQNYPDFEVVVVNNGSTDESDMLLRSLELKYSNIYHTYLPYSNDKKMSRYKLAFTLGVKAAKGDVVLFTQPYCKPESNNWISSMVKGLSDGKEVVLGYSFYEKSNHFYNRVARFDNHFFSMQYLSMAIKGKPYVGIFRNVAFYKHLFFDKKGFASLLHLDGGEEILINHIITSDNTAIALNQDSFVRTKLESFSLWKQIKKSYSVSKEYFEKGSYALFGFEYFSRSIYYLLFIALIAYSIVLQHWALLGITVFLFLLRLVIQLTTLSKSTKYFSSGKFYFSLPFLDFLQPYYNLRFRSRNSRAVKVKK